VFLVSQTVVAGQDAGMSKNALRLLDHIDMMGIGLSPCGGGTLMIAKAIFGGETVLVAIGHCIEKTGVPRLGLASGLFVYWLASNCVSSAGIPNRQGLLRCGGVCE